MRFPLSAQQGERDDIINCLLIFIIALPVPREEPGGMIVAQMPISNVMEGLRSLADELKESL